MKRTNLQVKAQRRNEILFATTGMMTTLTKFRDRYIKDLTLKGQLNSVICALSNFRSEMLSQRDNKNYLDSYYGLTQNDGSYERSKESDN